MLLERSMTIPTIQRTYPSNRSHDGREESARKEGDGAEKQRLDVIVHSQARASRVFQPCRFLLYGMTDGANRGELPPPILKEHRARSKDKSNASGT